MFLVKFILSSMLLGIVFINEASSMNATSPPPVGKLEVFVDSVYTKLY